MENDRRKEKRQKTSLDAGIFITQGENGNPVTPVFNCRLISISRHGAGVALEKIMHERMHLAFGPMESDHLFTNLTIEAGGQEMASIPARTIWFNKKTGQPLPPYRIGLEFLQPLSHREFSSINRLLG